MKLDTHIKNIEAGVKAIPENVKKPEWWSLIFIPVAIIVVLVIYFAKIKIWKPKKKAASRRPRRSRRRWYSRRKRR